MYRKLRILFLFIFCLLTLAKVNAQENDFKVNLNWGHQRHTWNAAWVTHPTAAVFDYSVLNFRNSFYLDEVADSSIIYVSADNRYKLFINEQEVASGPAKGSLQYWKYETIDIAPYLKEGKNVIAAEVFNLGEHRPVSLFSRRIAFILQGKGYLGNILNTGESNWLVYQNKAYSAIPVTNKMVRHFYAAGPCDQIDASLYPWGWRQPGFDDKNWLRPKLIERGVGRGYLHGVFWHLVPRDIPLMEQKVTRFKKAVRQEGIKIEPQFLSGAKSLEVPQHSKVKVLLDHEELTIGYPELIVSGGKNSSVKVTYGEALYGKDGTKGNRNEVEGKEMEGYYDIFLPDGGLKRKFIPLWLRTCRYVELEITTKEEPLEIKDFYVTFTAYPFQEKASFKSDDELLSKIWDVGWRTARLCAGETYMDCPYWEQLQYIGDSPVQSLISLYVSGDDRLMRNVLKQADQSRMPEGLTMGRAPTNVMQVIPPFSLFWINMAHDFYMHRDDPRFVKQLLPGIQSVLGWFERRLNTTNLLGPLDWYNFEDWTVDFPCGIANGADEGNSALISLQFSYSLEKASELFSYFGEENEAAKYKSLSGKIKKGVFKNCYNSQKSLFRDTPTDEIYSQHTNIWAVLTNAVPLEEQKELIRKVINDTSLIQTRISFRFYLFQAMYKVGLANDYLNQLGDWELMIDKGLSTFEEGDYDERSDCHAWSASPNYDLLATVCGIRPLKPGFKEIKIEPALGHLKSVDAKMPHPKGIIEVKLKSTDSHGLKGSVSLPHGTKGIFVWKNKEIKIESGYTKIDL